MPLPRLPSKTALNCNSKSEPQCSLKSSLSSKSKLSPKSKENFYLRCKKHILLRKWVQNSSCTEKASILETISLEKDPLCSKTLGLKPPNQELLPVNPRWSSLSRPASWIPHLSRPNSTKKAKAPKSVLTKDSAISSCKLPKTLLRSRVSWEALLRRNWTSENLLRSQAPYLLFLVKVRNSEIRKVSNWVSCLASQTPLALKCK